MADETHPGEQALNQRAYILSPSYVDPVSGAVYVHQDLVEEIAPWASKEHIAPVAVCEMFARVADWCFYVERYGDPDTTLLTFNTSGLRAVLDYHGTAAWVAEDENRTPGNRGEWQSRMPFAKSRELAAWAAFAGDHAVAQQAAVEFLEDHLPDITEPAAADLLGILRSLRANVKSEAASELRADGTMSVTFSRDEKVVAGLAQVELPPEVLITIPILKGEEQHYQLPVKIRVSVGNDSKLALRFSLKGAEKALDELIAELVGAARTTLGERYMILQAPD